MNGDFDQTDPGYIPSVSTETSAGGGSDFFGGFTRLASQFAERLTSAPTSTQNSVGGALYNAIYAFGAGKIDLARETAARALLNSRTGSRFVGEVEQQRIMARLPVILAGVGLLAFFVFMLARR
jgi:hypothetical protein